LDADRAPQLKAGVMLLCGITKRAIASAITPHAGSIAVAASLLMACSLLYIDREISGLVTLNQNWFEITPSAPLTIARDTHELTLFPDPPIQMVDDPTGKRSLIPADGRDADIEAQLIGSDGKTYRSTPGRSETMTGDLKITSRSLGFKDLPEGVTYTRVRIKSSVPYAVKRILWRNYNWGSVRK
jgi:hypothetical protein